MSEFRDYQIAAWKFLARDLEPNIALATLALGLTGESGEVADHLKKHLGHGHDLDKEHIKKELGDVLWYVACLAGRCGLDLGKIAEANIAKLKARYPEGFTQQASKERKEG